jgi:glutamate-ammonia-ligase adenylyltransferase
VKLSRGGIREIEFTVQLLQVVRGGQFPEMRTPPHAGGAAAPGPAPG